MPRPSSAALVLAAILAAPAAARAQEDAAFARGTAADAEPRTKIGIGVAAGIGFVGFGSDAASDLINAGGAWSVRATFGTRWFVAAELAYLGTAQAIQVPAMPDPRLIGSGLEGALRVNIGTKEIQPYVLGGVGWMHYAVRDADAAAMAVLPMRTSDEVLAVPLGAGVTFRAGVMFFDLRATYRFTASDDLLDFSRQDSLDTWSAMVRLGVEL